MCKFHTTAVFSQERADRCKPTNSDSSGQTTCVIAPIGTQNLGMNEASSRLLQIAIRNMRGEPTKKNTGPESRAFDIASKADLRHITATASPWKLHRRLRRNESHPTDR